MGRLSTIRDETVFAAAGAQLASEGAVTLQGLVAATGISIGSLYHRYGSREGLLAQAWIDAVSTFQDRFLAALAAGDEEAGLQAALATPRFCREQRDRAIILCCCRQVDFIAPATPPANLQTVRTINDKVAAALQAHAGKSGHSLAACRMGMVAFPLGAVRLYLPGQAVPEDVDDYVEAGFWAAMNADTGARS